ncbi:hypothetical protein OIE99_25790 [Streptomyces cellulosae]|nr:hypothetical protein OIE99_25790 [Streptomyces cellulosae]
MTDKWAGGVLRCVIGMMGVAAMLMLCGSLAGTAYAGEAANGSTDGPRAGLVNADPGQGHVTPFSDGQVWN